MQRQIGLSNLSLLPFSLIKGPEVAWTVAWRAGFDGMKINPLRGWDVTEVRDAGIPVLCFEAPWRHSLRESFQVLLRGDMMGFIADAVLFGKNAKRSMLVYSEVFPEAIGVDCPKYYYGEHPNFVRETDAKKWPGILDEDTPVCLDTWHIRTYPDAIHLFERLIDSGRVKTIDVQTRSYDEIRKFFIGEETTLGWQLKRLACLPRSVSACVEILPQHLTRLAWEFRGRQAETDILAHFQKRVRSCLN